MHDISCESSAGRRFSRYIIPYFFRKLRKMSQNLSSAAVVIGALRVKLEAGRDQPQLFAGKCRLLITFETVLDPYQAPLNAGPDLDPNSLIFLKELLKKISAVNKKA